MESGLSGGLTPQEYEQEVVAWLRTARLQDVKAHKAMMFATCGFQSGALGYATDYGITTIAFVNGVFPYETKAVGPAADHPPPPG